MLSNTTPMRAGMDPCVGVDGTNPYEGDLDELMIFDQALTPQQIAAVIRSLHGKN
jgi:hypothetical protein